MSDAGREGYFATFGAVLAREGGGVPRAVIDLARLEVNIDRVRAQLGSERLRLVVKSLPAPGLLRHVLARTGTRKLMSFHLPFLRQVAEAFPDADILLGKPLPMAALESFYRHPPRGRFEPAQQLHWLADTPQRLAHMHEFARGRGLTLGIAIELDVGMHRGGAADAETLLAMLHLVAQSQGTLRLDGFMGYDAHAAKAPWPGSAAGAARRARERYAALLAAGRSRFPALWHSGLILNGAGSPTYPLHAQDTLLNDVALGSVLLKPADFDLPQLGTHEAAAFIATPVLKRLSGVRLPFLESLAPITGWREDTLFLYGGRWMAVPAWPPGMRASRAYGQSSNQQLMRVPRRARVEAEDHAFFRPTQSESVLLQFGDLLAIRGDTLEARWPVLQQES